MAELTTKQISSQEKPKSFNESKKIANRGGNVARSAKLEFEKATGSKVVTSQNATNKILLDSKSKK